LPLDLSSDDDNLQLEMDVSNGNEVVDVDAEGDVEMNSGGQEKLCKRKVCLIINLQVSLADINLESCSNLPQPKRMITKKPKSGKPVMLSPRYVLSSRTIP
jgi:hypothetical protein